MEVDRLALDAIGRGGIAPLRRLLGGHGEQDGRVGSQAVGADVVDRAHRVGADPAHDALVDERAADEAVGDHGRPARERGCDDVLDELRACGGEQQRLGARAERSGAVEQQRADVLARLRPTWLAHLHDLAAERAQMLGEQPRLRRLARAVGALERDEPEAGGLRGRGRRVRGALVSRHARSRPRGYTRPCRAALLAPVAAALGSCASGEIAPRWPRLRTTVMLKAITADGTTIAAPRRSLNAHGET